MAVKVNIVRDRFEIEQPVELFSKTMNFAGTIAAARYAVSNDGQRFLMNMPLNARSDDHIIIVQNWLSELDD